jgi:ABC-type glutathione transport system ATPase component
MNAPAVRSTSALLYLSGVTVSFDGFKALNNLSLLIEPGEMRAIIGPNGAGKTTMMDVITGKTRPDTGEVVFDGQADLTKLDEASIATLGIGRKFQKPTVFESHTVRDNLLLALAGLRSWYKLLLATPTKAEENRHLDEILSIIRMEAPAAHAGRPSQPWPEAVAGDRHAAGPGPQAAAGRRAGGRHDRRRDRDDGAGAARDQQHALGRGGRARHELRARARASR